MWFTKVNQIITGIMALLVEYNRLGELQSVDGYMNIALEKTEEYVNGRLRRNYGDAFVRGNNGNCCIDDRTYS